MSIEVLVVADSSSFSPKIAPQDSEENTLILEKDGVSMRNMVCGRVDETLEDKNALGKMNETPDDSHIHTRR